MGESGRASPWKKRPGVCLKEAPTPVVFGRPTQADMTRHDCRAVGASGFRCVLNGSAVGEPALNTR